MCKKMIDIYFESQIKHSLKFVRKNAGLSNVNRWNMHVTALL
jgi:hypothetical protein